MDNELHFRDDETEIDDFLVDCLGLSWGVAGALDEVLQCKRYLSPSSEQPNK